jgi:hypothetical protein
MHIARSYIVVTAYSLQGKKYDSYCTSFNEKQIIILSASAICNENN